MMALSCQVIMMDVKLLMVKSVEMTVPHFSGISTCS